ncbi:MAG: carbon-nitrogen hydrolase family protein [Candidatus Bipolaricaulia bacterium]
MRLALVQMKVFQEMDKNLEKSLECIEEASGNGAKLVCFPEIQFSPFFPQFSQADVSKYVTRLDHDIVKALQKQAKELGVVVVPNLYLEEKGARYDASPVIDADGSVLGISKMVHIVQMACFYEQDYYTPSDAGFHVYDTSVGKVGVVICFDRHYPESIRSCTLKEAQIIVIPTANIKGEPLEKFEWELRIAAMQNNVFIAMCNRVGNERDMHFCGESIVVDPNGDVVAKADDTEQILYADIDLAAIEASRNESPYLKLRRPEIYKEIYS